MQHAVARSFLSLDSKIVLNRLQLVNMGLTTFTMNPTCLAVQFGQMAEYLCPKCGKKITKVPLANYRENGKLWHIPHTGKAKCDNCGWESGPYGRNTSNTPSTESFAKRFANMSDTELVKTFVIDRGKLGWVSSRATFLAALRGEFTKRGLEYPPSES